MQYQTKGAKNIRFEYDQLGNICSIHGKAGRIHYRVDENALTLTATFQGV
jgi:YD repeat-containing protein